MTKIGIFSVVCIFFTIASPIYSISKIANLEETNTALSLFYTIRDLYQISTDKNDSGELTKQLSDFKNNVNPGISSLFERLDKLTYQNALTGYINKIDSCQTDHFNYVANPSEESRNNLLKCTDIMESVRPLGKYLSGGKILDAPLLFDLYKNREGICDGPAMESTYKTLFADYAIGCNVASTLARIEHGRNASLYAMECNDTMSQIIDYVKRLYHTCAPPSCRIFHCSVQKLFSKDFPASPDDLHKKLSEMYPWFNFLIFEFEKRGKTTVGGKFFARHDDDHEGPKGTMYEIFFFDGFKPLTKEEHSLSLVIQVSRKSLIDLSFGNSSMKRDFHEGLDLGTYIGYAPENNFLCNDRNTDDNRQCPKYTGKSPILFPVPSSIFYLFFLLRVSMGLLYFP
uniref:Uncharacterized protein LOC111099583 n=1 Tax=Crassostrea virginica TaxID=6565 RepID=A0A8B8A561_CRAVI|nr:uncharacterized protein LOC111099583 [Crassostrea virginica]XP_022286612.1 uncharacterized protein LOC111099583 [Crassostrea virginica]XP_022286613.1 uncharacterized protein LOC111099583 [Crassostrea virginica]